MKTILITGINGQLGYDIYRKLDLENKINRLYYNQNKYLIYAPSRDELDITNRKNVIIYISKIQPDYIIHCAAYTQVDKAEIEQDNAYLVNFEGTKNLCDIASYYNSTLIFTSTDYVFDGLKKGKYTEFDNPNPQNVYGMTKFLAEQQVQKLDKHIIARVSWLYGINGNNFVKTMLSLSNKGVNDLNIVDDQIGSPTYTKDAANAIVQLMNSCYHTKNYGIYHIINEGEVSWADFAKEIFTINNKNVNVNKITTQEYINAQNKVVAVRPLNSCLSKNKINEIGINMPKWDNALYRYSNEISKTLKRK